MDDLTVTIPADMLESLIRAVGLEVSYTYTQARERRTNEELPAIFDRRKKLWALQDKLRAMQEDQPEDDPLTPEEIAREHDEQAKVEALADKDSDVTGYYTHTGE